MEELSRIKIECKIRVVLRRKAYPSVYKKATDRISWCTQVNGSTREQRMIRASNRECSNRDRKEAKETNRSCNHDIPAYGNRRENPCGSSAKPRLTCCPRKSQLVVPFFYHLPFQRIRALPFPPFSFYPRLSILLRL
jgi:hypothetical protein